MTEPASPGARGDAPVWAYCAACRHIIGRRPASARHGWCVTCKTWRPVGRRLPAPNARGSRA